MLAGVGSTELFLNRESELAYLQNLPVLKSRSLGGNVFLEGFRGAGKTELLKRLYLILFHRQEVAPFYYSFKAANWKGSFFARDYFAAFARQYVSFLKREGVAAGPYEPLAQIIANLHLLGLTKVAAVGENLALYQREKDVYGQIVTALSAPAAAAREGGKPVLLLWDDFDLAGELAESARGDSPGLAGLVGFSLGAPGCAHVITGAPGGMAVLFTEPSLIGMTEKLILSPLPFDLAVRLFQTHAANLSLSCPTDMPADFLLKLQGNPLYLRNLAKGAAKMQKTELAERDLIESYAYDVTYGETAFYWTSLLGQHFPEASRRLALLENMHEVVVAGKANAFQLREGWVDSLLALGANLREDAVLQDVIRSWHATALAGKSRREAYDSLVALYLTGEDDVSFEVTIPMQANAELVVAKAVEQIGKNIELDGDFLDYLQLALIEVCINAMEHSGGYERKVAMKLAKRREVLTIEVESAGRPFAASARQMDAGEKLQQGIKRGWGLKLINSIMDSVKIERLNDRTRVLMTKKIAAKEVN